MTVELGEHDDLSRLLRELASKGYRPAQLEAVRSGWEAACQGGAHPNLAAAAHALAARSEAAAGSGGYPGTSTGAKAERLRRGHGEVENG